jgi:hypothetical protein
MGAHEANIAAVHDCGEPSLAEVLLMFTAVAFVHVGAIVRVRNYWDVAAHSFDNAIYLRIAGYIRAWHFPGGEVPWNFWGYPYAIAGVSKLFSIRALTAAALISVLSSLAVSILVRRLYGGWVATAFIFINYEWIQLSFEGNSEPLFIFLLYASLLAARSDRWNLAALLASLSTTVRPVGVFALVAFAAILAIRRSYRQLAAVTIIGLGIGALYIGSLWRLVGSPVGVGFAEFYRRAWGPYRWPVTLPFRVWVSSFLAAYGPFRWYRLAFFAVWPVVASLGTISMWLPRNRTRFSGLLQEVLLASMYTLFFLSFVDAALEVSFPRYLTPVLPLLLFSLRDWIPRDRRVLWAAALVSALLASAAEVHFQNVFGFRP